MSWKRIPTGYTPKSRSVLLRVIKPKSSSASSLPAMIILDNKAMVVKTESELLILLIVSVSQPVL